MQATLTADLGGFDGQEDNDHRRRLPRRRGRADRHRLVPPAGERGRPRRQDRLRPPPGLPTLPAGVRQALIAVIATLQTPAPTTTAMSTTSTFACRTPPARPRRTRRSTRRSQQPEARVNANAQATSGRILVKRPGGTEFQELSDSRSIPIGSEIDATKGVGRARDGGQHERHQPEGPVLRRLVRAHPDRRRPADHRPEDDRPDRQVPGDRQGERAGRRPVAPPLGQRARPLPHPRPLRDGDRARHEVVDARHLHDHHGLRVPRERWSSATSRSAATSS